mgnify:CR=1 FL=1
MSTYIAQPESKDEKSSSEFNISYSTVSQEEQANQKRLALKRRPKRAQLVEAIIEDDRQKEKSNILSKATSWMPYKMPSMTEVATSVSNVLKAGGTEEFIIILILIAVVYRARLIGNTEYRNA